MSKSIRILENEEDQRRESLQNDDEEALLFISRNATAARRETAQRSSRASPDDGSGTHSDLQTLLGQIDRDPYVGYVAETNDNYVVTLRGSRPLAVPKAHSRPEIFPPVAETPGERAMGMIGWMVFGMIPAGVVALILCPFVLREGFGILRSSSVRRERQLALVSVIAAIMLGVVAEVFVLLLLLHMIG